jgi:hypothetical protein
MKLKIKIFHSRNNKKKHQVNVYDSLFESSFPLDLIYFLFFKKKII